MNFLLSFIVLSGLPPTMLSALLSEIAPEGITVSDQASFLLRLHLRWFR